MTPGKTLTMIFDGQVLRPDTPLDLEPNQRYLVTIQNMPSEQEQADAWGILTTLTGTIEAPPDWSSEHDHYIYGTPKQEDTTH